VCAVRRRLIVLFVVLLVGSALAEAFLPRAVQRGLEVGLANMLGGEPDVRLRAFPSLKLLLGRFDSITVESQGVQAGSLLIDSISCTLEEVAVSMRALLLERTVVVERVGKQHVTMRISESSLRGHVARTVSLLQEPRVVLRDGIVAVQGKVNVGRQPVLLAVDGTFEPDAENSSRIRYHIRRLRLDGVEAEGAFLGGLITLLGGPEVFIDLRQAPLPMQVTEVAVKDGWLVIRAQVVEATGR